MARATRVARGDTRGWVRQRICHHVVGNDLVYHPPHVSAQSALMGVRPCVDDSLYLDGHRDVDGVYVQQRISLLAETQRASVYAAAHFERPLVRRILFVAPAAHRLYRLSDTLGHHPLHYDRFPQSLSCGVLAHGAVPRLGHVCGLPKPYGRLTQSLNYSSKYFAKYLNKKTNTMTTTSHTSYHKLERIIKGFANHRRLQMLELLAKEPELSLNEIAERLRIGYENASDHVRKLAIGGLVLKRHEGNCVRHKITNRAERVLVFCKKLQQV